MRNKNKKNVLYVCICIGLMAFGVSGCAGPEKTGQTETEKQAERQSAAQGPQPAADTQTEETNGGETNGENGIAPEAPYGTKVSGITDEGIEYYWKRPEYADGYEVFRCYEEEGDYEKIAEIDTRSVGTYTDNTFDSEKREVWYKIRSYLDNEDGTRSYSKFTKSSRAKYRESLKLERKKTYMPSGSSRRIQAFYGWGNVQDAQWKSDNPEVAEITDEGVITAVSKGTCKLTCTSESLGETASTKVIVDREAPEPLTEITSRYVQSEDTGIWENPDAEKTGDAVIMMVGDMMCTSAQIRAHGNKNGNYNFNESYDYIRDIISRSDFAVGNLETTLSSSWPYMTNETYINNKPNCNAPSRYLDAVRYGGFDGVVMSNNHNCDAGERGVIETIEQVERYQLARTGLFTGQDDCRYMLADVNGIKVGYLSYSSESPGYNGKDKEWPRESVDTMLNYFTQEKAKQDIETVRSAGADYVIVYMHWGVKNYRAVNEDQTGEAQQLAEAGADYIVGSHPHLLQKYEEITTSDGRVVPCFYSLGDFQSSILQIEGNRDSVILRIRLTKNADGQAELSENNYIPCYNYTEYEDRDYPVIPLNPDLNGNMETPNMEKFRSRIAKSVGDKMEEYSTR